MSMRLGILAAGGLGTLLAVVALSAWGMPYGGVWSHGGMMAGGCHDGHQGVMHDDHPDCDEDMMDDCPGHPCGDMGDDCEGQMEECHQG